MLPISDHDLAHSLKLSEQGTKYVMALMNGEAPTRKPARLVNHTMFGIVTASYISFLWFPAWNDLATLGIFVIFALCTFSTVVLSIATLFTSTSRLCDRSILLALSPLTVNKRLLNLLFSLLFVSCLIAAFCTGNKVAGSVMVLIIVIIRYGMFCTRRNFRERIEAAATEAHPQDQT